MFGKVNLGNKKIGGSFGCSYIYPEVKEPETQIIANEEMDENEEFEPDPIEEKKYLPGERLLEQLKKIEKKKVKKIRSERLAERLAKVVKIF